MVWRPIGMRSLEKQAFVWHYCFVSIASSTTSTSGQSRHDEQGVADFKADWELFTLLENA